MAKNLPKGITLRKDGRYMWRFKYNNVAYSGYSKNITDAKKALLDKRYEVEHGIYSKEQTISLDAWFEEWLRVYKSGVIKDSTYNLYEQTYRRYIKPKFGKSQVKKLRADSIQKFMNELANSYSKSIVSSVNFLLYDALEQAKKCGIINVNPMDVLNPPKCEAPKKKMALSEENELIFLDAAKKSGYYPIYRMASLTGMRMGEILGLQWEDVDFDKGEIHIRHTLSYISGRGQYLDKPKSKTSYRIIPMLKDSEVYRLLRERRKEQCRQRLKAGEHWHTVEGLENLVFTTKCGTPIYDINIRTDQRQIVAGLKEKGIDIGDCTFHTLRHCFATRCIENGMNPKTLQAILGHSTFSMTMDLYCDVMEDTKRKEMENIMVAL